MFPGKYDEVQKIMNSLVCNTTYSTAIYKPSIAYTYCRTNELCGDIFKIFVNNSDKELTPYLYLHECGHIIFAHAKNMDMRTDKLLKAKISAAYKKIENLFPDEKSFYKTFSNLVFNIVMDFEVNSRLFDESEWNFMQEKVSQLLNKKSKGFWPEDYGFECGRTWNEYLNLILLDPEEFFTRFRFIKHLAEQKASEFDGHMSQKEYDDFKKEAWDKKLLQDELDEVEKEAGDHNESTFSIPTGISGRTENDALAVTINFKTYDSQDNLLTSIKKLLQIKTKGNTKRDIMYNENRRKINSGVIVPKTFRGIVHTTAKLYMLIDVSGSVDAKAVYNFIATFKKVSAEFKETRVITWTTRLLDDWNIKDQIPNRYGGGTKISGGIRYIRETYTPGAKDAIFIISDFDDNMDEWHNELQKINCRKFAVNWQNKEGRKTTNPGFEKIIEGYFE